MTEKPDHSVLNELRDEIALLRKEIHGFRKGSSVSASLIWPDNVSTASCDRIYSGPLGLAGEELSKGMVVSCPMCDTCHRAFMDFLEETGIFNTNSSHNPDISTKYAEKLSYLKTTAPYQKCSQCFEETERLFEQQRHLILSPAPLDQDFPKIEVLAHIPADEIVVSYIEPLANRHRFLIVCLLAEGPTTFSELSKKTGLRSGNLIFHLKKLQESDCITQHYERGDYILTQKGLLLLNAYVNIWQKFKPPE